jgi:hypothetical protein
MSEAEWNNAVVLKRSGSGSVWEDVSSKVISRNADGLLGKLIITDLSSFSDFAIGSTEILLPVTWVDFTAQMEGNAVRLNWATAAELNAKDFVVQHSQTGIDWYDIGEVAAVGNSNSEQHYTFLHTVPASGNNFYRLKQRDLDGRFSYSVVRKLVFTGSTNRILILGNPVVNGNLRISLSEATKLSVRTMDGRVLLTRNLTAGRHTLELGHQAPGTYLLVAEQEVIRFLVK